MSSINTTAILTHVRTIVRRDVEVREVAISSFGMSLKLDTRKGESERDIVQLVFDECDGLTRCIAYAPAGVFIGEWFVQGDIRHDHDAAWFAVMANRSGRGDYWLDQPELVA